MPAKKARTTGLPEGLLSDRGWVVQGYMIWRSGRQFNPPTDIIELTDRIVVLVEIAGMKGDDFNIALMSNHLVVTGYRERSMLQNPAYHQVEIGFGEFRIEVVLPWSVKQEEVTATYRDGFLRIDLPRRETTQVHIVDVNVDQQNE